MTTAIAKPQTAVTEYVAPEGGWEDDGNSDIQPSFPVITIVQPMSQAKEADKHVGEFYHSDSETFTPTLDVVGLVRHETRALFEDGKDKPACMSFNGKEPQPNQPVWTQATVTIRKTEMGVPFTRAPRACAECPFSEWNGDQPPLCKNSNIILVDRGEDDLAQLRISGTSIKPYRQFVARKLIPKHQPLFTQRLHLSTEIKVEPGRKWAQLVIGNTPLSQKEADRYNAILGEQRARFEDTLRAEGSVGVEWDDEQSGALSEFMANVHEALDAAQLHPNDLAKYMRKTFTEENVRKHMAMAGVDLVELIGLAGEFASEDGTADLPFE